MNSLRHSPWAIVVLTTSVVAFWGLRAGYWMVTEELPFSDMADFDRVARGIVTSFDFSWSPFWQTYTTPSLVTARALQIVLFGDSMTAWRIFQSALVFVALLWMALEIVRATGSRWLGIALVSMVALSKPSIFWSLKLSREGFHEALLYAVVAATLFAIRRPGYRSYALAGVVVTVTFLNKPNCVVLVPMVLALMLFGRWPREVAPLRVMAQRSAAYAIAIAALWSPWVARSVLIYGEPVPLSIQGPYTFLWSVGEVEVRLGDGTMVRTDVNRLQARADRDFPNDLAASRYASAIAGAWLVANWQALPAMAWTRVRESLRSRTIYLTKVPRDVLFGKPLDRLLLDKQVSTIAAGAAGLVVMPFLYGPGLAVLVCVAALSWVTAAALVPYPRMLEASIPLLLFGNVAWIVMGWRIWFHRPEAVVAKA